MHLKHKYLACGLAAVLGMPALPAAAASWTQPGATMGSPAGAVPPPGLYFVNSANYGIGTAAGGATQAVGAEIPAFVWVPGWNVLGASYAASVAFPLVDIGIRTPGHAADLYLRGVFNPVVNPVTLSWNLGNGVFVAVGENVYLPMNSDVIIPPNGGLTSGASFETMFNVSYIGNDWILSANSRVGLTTDGSGGYKTPDYINSDWTVAHTFGKWELGVVGYGAWDIQRVPLAPGASAQSSPSTEIGFGGLIGYNLGPVDVILEATHEVVTKGTFNNYGRNDTRVWTTVVIPIWNPAPATPLKPLAAKY